MANSTIQKKDIVLKWVESVIPANDNHVAITAVPDTGYTFLSWLGCTTQGWVGYVGIEFLDVPSVNVWNLNFQTVSTNSSIRAYFLQKRI